MISKIFFFPKIENNLSCSLFGHKVWEQQMCQFENAYTISYDSFKTHKFYLNQTIRKEKITELKDIELTENTNIKKKFIKERDGQIPFNELLKKEKIKIKFNLLEKLYFVMRRKFDSRKKSRKNY